MPRERERRQQEFIRRLAESLNDVHTRLDEDYVRSDGFAELAEEFFERTQSRREMEKVEYYAAALANAATPERPEAAEQVALRADTLTDVVRQLAESPAGPDRLALTRIGRDREAATNRYLRDRDVVALERTMARLDREEADASRIRESNAVPADIAIRYLKDLAATWRAADGGPGRRMLAEALFERIDAFGFRELRLRLTDHAVSHGFAATLPERMEVGIVGTYRAYPYQLICEIAAREPASLPYGLPART